MGGTNGGGGLGTLLAEALADEERRLAALEARLVALRGGPVVESPASDSTQAIWASLAERGPSALGPAPAPMAEVDVDEGHDDASGHHHEQAHDDDADDWAALAAEAPPAPPASGEDDPRLEAARRLLAESGQGLQELRACLSRAPGWEEGGARPVDDADDAADADDADDEHADGTPGEGPPAVPSLDRRGVPVASRYAGLDRSSCEAELRRRRIAFTRVGEARGVVAPLRLAGPLSGVTFRSNLPASKSRTSPYDIYDCRLVLALDDFARVLTKHDIVEVVHLSVYRPVSKKVALKGAGRRHGGALAIDAALFKTKDGRTLSVEKDFRPRRIGARPCPAPATASELRKIACEASDAQLFNVLLTPHYNRAHRNHFHLEVTAGVRWTLVR
ncbi:MAG: extensin family protein [Labilithrix sp.]|nr:extensin family protein [Labilithrix sp.]